MRIKGQFPTAAHDCQPGRFRHARRAQNRQRRAAVVTGRVFGIGTVKHHHDVPGHPVDQRLDVLMGGAGQAEVGVFHLGAAHGANGALLQGAQQAELFDHVAELVLARQGDVGADGALLVEREVDQRWAPDPAVDEIDEFLHGSFFLP